MSTPKKARFGQFVQQSQEDELKVLIRRLARLEGLGDVDRAVPADIARKISRGEFSSAASAFRIHFMNYVVQLRVDFDKTVDFDRIHQILLEKASSESAAAPVKKSRRGTKACAECPERWGVRKKKCDNCGYQFPVKSKPEEKNDGAAGAASVSSSEPIETGPFALRGFYPLYNTVKGANAAGDGSHHEHRIDGTLYFMPNGVAFYHGNYSTEPEPEPAEPAPEPPAPEPEPIEPEPAEPAPEPLAPEPEPTEPEPAEPTEPAPNPPVPEPEPAEPTEPAPNPPDGESKESADESKEDAFDSPETLNTSDRVLIRLKPKWRKKLLQEDGQSFVRGESKIKKAVQKTYDILTKKKVKSDLLSFPARSLKKWQNTQIREKWKGTRDTKPPQKFDEEDTLVKEWRTRQPEKAEPLPVYLPEDDFEFLMEEVNESSLEVYLEDGNNSGNLNESFKYRSAISKEYIEWKKLPDLEEGESDEQTRFAAALDCLHAFGGEGKPFADDMQNILLLTQHLKKLDSRVAKLRKKIEAREEARRAASGEFKDAEIGPLRDELDAAVAAADWDKDPPLVFDPNFVELSAEDLKEMSATDRDLYLDDEETRRQLIIRQWAVAIGMLQMPDGRARGQKAQRFEIKFEGDPAWYLAVVVENDPSTQTIRFKYVNPPENGDDDWVNPPPLDFTLDTFRLLEELPGDDEAITQSAIENEDAEQIAEDEAADDAESSEDEDEEADAWMGDDVFVEYVNASGDLIVGQVQGRRLREDDVAPDVRVTDPYEYDVDGVWVGSEKLSLQDGKEYETDDEVVCPDGQVRTIESTDADLAFFADYAGDDGVTFDELDEAKLKQEDGGDASDEEQEAADDALDTTEVQQWRGRTVRVIEPEEPYLARVKEQEKQVPPFNVPYLEHSEKEWAKLRTGKGDEQPELVDLQDAATGQVFRKVPVDELNQDAADAEDENESEVEEDELEQDDAEEQGADDAMSSDDGQTSEDDDGESEPEDDLVVTDAEQETDSESEADSDQD